ncbi:MAG TPA: NADPH-dependent FMN reductase, partial [Thermoanaerobaculia bacterium]|nr:NADPH-dependent FMN reductase [Thermoanaerobaculia bacterium]
AAHGLDCACSTMSTDLKLRLLALSGSLRARSSNAAALKAAAALAPAGVSVHLYEGLGELPHFNPDFDTEGALLPEAVAALRAEVQAADGLLISCPEYAHGVPGSFKNALDWLVSGSEIVGKPVAFLQTSPLATFAPAALHETLRVMSARLVEEAFVTFPLRTGKIDEAAILTDRTLSDALRQGLTVFCRAILEGRST